MNTLPKILVTEYHWIHKGMELFARSGVDGLVIEKMATELGCSKSSFYWYFKNRNDYVLRLVESWSEITTQQLIRNSSVSTQAEEQLANMLTEMFSLTQKGDFLFFFRKLAENNPDFRVLLDKIERTRMEYAQTLFQKLGMAPEAAEQKSGFLYHYYLGWYERHKNESLPEEELQRHIGMLRVHLLGV